MSQPNETSEQKYWRELREAAQKKQEDEAARVAALEDAFDGRAQWQKDLDAARRAAQ